MKIYEVGGAVRDYILGKVPHDIDYVVVGSTPEEMQKKGFMQVGKSFPVFLHPDTRAEYALARTERKIGKKHTDFAFDFSADISLDEDLRRRDFTCNALARDTESGEIIDKFDGIKDIKNKVLRHIDSEHFIEDPLRILRMCRFSAQLDFEIAPETMALAKNMVANEMLANLSRERIREEILKILRFKDFARALKAMEDCGAFAFLLYHLSEYLKDENYRDQFYADLKACENMEPMAKFALFFRRMNDRDKIIADCKTICVPLKFKDFVLNFCKYEKYFEDTRRAEDEFLFDMLKDAGHLKDLTPTVRMMKILQDLGYEQEYNKKRCELIIKLCADNRVNTMPGFAEMPKNSRIAQKYKTYILQKLKDLK